MHPIKALPKGEIKEIREPGRVVLAHGEVTGHAHAIYDIGASVLPTERNRAADEMTEATIARAQKSSKATCRLVEIEGDHFFEVIAPAVELKHEEHSSHQVVRAFYEVPIQVEYTAERVRRVED